MSTRIDFFPPCLQKENLNPTERTNLCSRFTVHLRYALFKYSLAFKKYFVAPSNIETHLR